MSYPRGTIIRNTTAARINHWITAACFVLLMLSGLSMFHPLLSFLALLFGSGQWARAVHPWIGCVLLVSYAGLIVQFWRDNFWNRDDVAWTGAIVRVLRNDEEDVPEVPRFNTGRNSSSGRWCCFCRCCSSPALRSGTPISAGDPDRDSAHRRADPQHGGGGGDHDLDHPCLRGDLGARLGPRHDARLRHARLGLAPPSQVVPRLVATGSRGPRPRRAAEGS